MSDLPTQVRAVKDHIRARIIRAELVEGHRLDARDIRQTTGGSVRVVRQALNELAQEGLLSRRQRVGTFVAGGVARSGLSPLPAIRAVAVLSSLSKEQLAQSAFAADIIEGIQHALSQPARIEFCVPASGAQKANDVLPTVEAEVLRSLVQGVVAIEANHSGRLNKLARAGLPVVSVDFSPRDAAFDAVCVDHEEAGALSTAHLLAIGHRRIAFVGESGNPHSTDPAWQDRMAGYLRAMAWSGSETPQPLILGGPRDPSKMVAELPEFHRRHQPTAYVLATGQWAPAFLGVMNGMGLSCPKDVSLVCADATCPRMNAFTISNIRSDYEEVGRVAIQLLAGRISCRGLPEVNVKLPVVFTPGDSSQALP